MYSLIDGRLKEGGQVGMDCGNYFTRGAWAAPDFLSLRSGSALVGEGDDWTSLVLLNPQRFANGKERPDMRILHIGAGTRVEDCSIYGPSREDGQFWMVTAGIRGYGTSENIRIRRVSVHHIRGCLEPHPMDGFRHEAFGISFDPGNGDILVDDCRVYGEPDSYVSAFSGVYGATRPVIFNRCFAWCRRGGYAAYTVYDNTVIRDCGCETFGYAIYNDTGSVNNALVDGGNFTATRVGIGFVGEAQTTKQNIRVRDAVFTLFGPDPVGLELVAKGASASFCGIDVVGCRFVYNGQSKFCLFSALADPSRCRAITFRDCVLPSNTVLNPRGVPYQLINCRYENGLPMQTLPVVS